MGADLGWRSCVDTLRSGDASGLPTYLTSRSGAYSLLEMEGEWDKTLVAGPCSGRSSSFDASYVGAHRVCG